MVTIKLIQLHVMLKMCNKEKLVNFIDCTIPLLTKFLSVIRLNFSCAREDLHCLHDKLSHVYAERRKTRTSNYSKRNEPSVQADIIYLQYGQYRGTNSLLPQTSAVVP